MIIGSIDKLLEASQFLNFHLDFSNTFLDMELETFPVLGTITQTKNRSFNVMQKSLK